MELEGLVQVKVQGPFPKLLRILRQQQQSIKASWGPRVIVQVTCR